MSARSCLTVAFALLLSSAPAALADGSNHSKSYHRQHYAAPVVVPPEPAPWAYGPRLVLHPAWNIACNTRDSGTRALPCNQPVWVYGSPCEIGLGRGFYRNCE